MWSLRNMFTVSKPGGSKLEGVGVKDASMDAVVVTSMQHTFPCGEVVVCGF